VSVSRALRRDSPRVARVSGEGRSSLWQQSVAQECMAQRTKLDGFSSVGLGWLRVAHIHVAHCASSSVHPARCSGRLARGANTKSIYRNAIFRSRVGHFC
ncbi:hypothetical protein A2U01_0053581, partial [Trifolium medium]|nr:hypothetical protein [Trifolium medium]